MKLKDIDRIEEEERGMVREGEDIYGAVIQVKHIPILSRFDPLSWKMVRSAHISEAGIHRTFRGTYTMLISGKFPIVCSNMTLLIKKFMNNCEQCYKEQKKIVKTVKQSNFPKR